MKRDSDGSKLQRARELRRDNTLAEVKLWEQLRAKRFNDFKFVRQQSIGPYFADFVCRSHKFIIEVDGATHSTVEELRQDEARVRLLQPEGYRVFRISNDEVLNAMDQLLTLIAEAMGRNG